MMIFRNRRDAGTQLAEQLVRFAGRNDVVVLALPRGGVPVAYEVARALQVPLDVLVVRKIGAPGAEELALGAIASGDVIVFNEELRAIYPGRMIQPLVDAERREVVRREQLLRGDRPAARVAGQTVLLIDDGLATGATMMAAVRAIRHRSPARVIVAVPVGAEDSIERLRKEADEVICLSTPPDFRAVGLWYDDFDQVADEEVRDLLDRSASASHDAVTRDTSAVPSGRPY